MVLSCRERWSEIDMFFGSCFIDECTIALSPLWLWKIPLKWEFKLIQGRERSGGGTQKLTPSRCYKYPEFLLQGEYGCQIWLVGIVRLANRAARYDWLDSLANCTTSDCIIVSTVKLILTVNCALSHLLNQPLHIHTDFHSMIWSRWSSVFICVVTV